MESHGVTYWNSVDKLKQNMTRNKIPNSLELNNLIP